MKKLTLLILISIFFISCNSIPNKSISEKLTIEELSKAIKSDAMFVDFYEDVTKKMTTMDDIQKARFNDITYRRLFKFYISVDILTNDTIYRNSSTKKQIELEKEIRNDKLCFDFYMLPI